MKLYAVYRVDYPTHKELAAPGVTCAHTPLFACSWKWLCEFVRPFVGGEFVLECGDEDKPIREGVIDYTTGYYIFGEHKGKRWYSD